jgi:hypothetical protein
LRAWRAALLHSLVQSCKLVDVPLFDYVKDVRCEWPPTRSASSTN